MRDAQDLEAEAESDPYQKSRMFQAIDNVKAAHETSRANAVTTLVYDAQRAAVDVHLNASGLRIIGRDQHALAVEYAHTALGELISATDLTTYDELRLVRHRIVDPPIGRFQPLSTDEAVRFRDAADRMVTALATWHRSQL